MLILIFIFLEDVLENNSGNKAFASNGDVLLLIIRGNMHISKPIAMFNHNIVANGACNKIMCIEYL